MFPSVLAENYCTVNNKLIKPLLLFKRGKVINDTHFLLLTEFDLMALFL